MGKKMGFTEKQVSHMSFRKFCLLHRAYKNVFDMEATLKYNKLTYSDLEKEKTLDDVLPF